MMHLLSHTPSDCDGILLMLGIETNDNDERITMVIIKSFLGYIWTITHWLFIWHYLQVACPIKITFMQCDESVPAQIKLFLIDFNIVMLLTIADVFLPVNIL